MTLTIRTLTTSADIHAARRLAYDVCVRERGLRSALADHERKLLTSERGGLTILAAFDDGALVGTLSMQLWADRPFPDFYDELFMLERFDPVAPRDTWMVFTRMVIQPSARAQLVTMQLCLAAYDHSQARGVELMFTDVRPDRLDTCRKAGFHTFAPPFEYDGGGVGIPLVALCGDHQHLRALNSPMLLLVDPAREHPALAARARAALASCDDPILTTRSDPDAYRAALRSLLDDTSSEGSPFAGFSLALLEDLLERGSILECREGLSLICARQDTRAVYVVLDGELAGVRERHEFRVGPGEVLGEIALLTGCRRTADVHVRSETARVLCLSERNIRALVDAHSLSAARFLRNLSTILAARLAS